MPYRTPEPLRDDHRLEGFQSEEPALDEWLKRYARTAQVSHSSRVYVATTDEDPGTVVGYFALAATSVAPENVTPRALEGEPRNRTVPAILLARLARDLRHRGSGLGPSLLQDALLRCNEAADIIGARVLLVHAMHPKAKDFYMKHGFDVSPTDPLHLLLLMKDVRSHLQKKGKP